jgi:hypothetical protein
MRLACPTCLGTTGLLIGALFTSVPTAGCDDEEECVDYSPPASFDLQNPKVSFAAAVVPIFRDSCAFSTCHGSTTGNPNGVFLGGNDAPKIHAAIVDVRSSKLPSMSYVKAGDPRESFLMRKMDGSHCVLDAQCTASDCGDSMPRGEDRLDVGRRDIVRRWIAQGAKND